jgi:iron complex transport system substrate-binding protein
VKQALAIVLLLAAAMARASSAPAIGTAGAALAPPRAQAPARPTRIVSLIPAVTEMIYAMGDGSRVAAVSSYDHFPADVDRLPRVGGLLDPSVERILAIKPDLVIVYATQKELIERLDRAGIPYFSYQHRALADIMTTIRAVGARIGSAARGEAVATDMDRSLAAIRARTADLPHPATLLVFEREPGSLRNVYASGGYDFLPTCSDRRRPQCLRRDEAAGSASSTEMLLTGRIIVELRYTTA